MRGMVTAAALASFLLGGLADTVWAQGTVKPTAAAPAQAPFADTQGPTVAIEGRFGALWPQPPLVTDGSGNDTSTTQPILGGRASWYFTSQLDRRLNVQFVFDHASLGSLEYIDPETGGEVKREGHWWALTAAIAFDVVKTRRFSVDIHGGPSVVGEWRTFLLKRANPSCTYNSMLGTTCEGEFENVCLQTAYQDRCEIHERTVLSLGAGARWYAFPAMYVGVDYTWFRPDRHVLVGTVGFRYPPRR